MHRMSDLLPGDHLCYLYESERERREVLIMFVRQGLDWHEKILYVADPPGFEGLAEGLRAQGVDPAGYVESGQITVLAPSSLFGTDRGFDPAAMIEIIEDETEKAMDQGFNGLRVTVETQGVLKETAGEHRLLEFENLLNGFFPGKRCLALCQYHSEDFSPALFHQVLAIHPAVLAGNSVHRNPYYVPPRSPEAEGDAMPDVETWLERLGAGEGPVKAGGAGSSGMVATLFRWEYPEVLEQYLDELSEVAVAILDRGKNILHCNRGFLRLLNQSNDPGGRNLAEFLIADSLAHLPFPPPGAHKKTRLNFLPTGSVVHTLNCFIFGTLQGYVIVGERIMLTNNDIVAGISNLTNELASVTHELQKKCVALERANAVIGKLAVSDPVTGLFNSRSLMAELSRAVSLARRHGGPLSLAVGGPDPLTPARTHDRSEETLKDFVALLAGSCRKEDFFACLEGGRFAVILPHTDLSGAAVFAKKITESFVRPAASETAENLTVSFGITGFAREDTPENIIRRAATALDEARRAGGNRVEER
ncbi:MEDS domain-containing protein [Syntrophobacter fumaroxidans]|nr:MEDS domain-containing protein [Syntrophobacter fumaroxidans]